MFKEIKVWISPVSLCYLQLRWALPASGPPSIIDVKVAPYKKIDVGLGRGLPMAALTYWGWDKMAAILADDNFKCNCLNENVRISFRISLKFVPRSPIDNKPALVQVMACRFAKRQAIIWTNDD